MNDLVDSEMIELLNVIKLLKAPKLEDIKHKFVSFGPRQMNSKVLILDMDETLLHARFLQNEEDEKDDDGDFSFTLQSASSGSKDVEGQPGNSLKVSIKMRPFLDMSLDFLARYYEICVFTAGT
jgi:TFIIF-interacting CTD phosphatase-like protein